MKMQKKTGLSNKGGKTNSLQLSPRPTTDEFFTKFMRTSGDMNRAIGTIKKMKCSQAVFLRLLLDDTRNAVEIASAKELNGKANALKALKSGSVLTSEAKKILARKYLEHADFDEGMRLLVTKAADSVVVREIILFLRQWHKERLRYI